MNQIDEIDEIDETYKSDEIKKIHNMLASAVTESYTMPSKGMLGDTGLVWDSSKVVPSSLSLKEEDETHVLTPQILKRLIQMVKEEFPEDNL